MQGIAANCVEPLAIGKFEVYPGVMSCFATSRSLSLQQRILGKYRIPFRTLFYSNRKEIAFTMPQPESLVACAIENSVVTVTLLAEKLREPQVVEIVKKEMLAAVQSGNVKSVIIDFRNVQFIGSMAFLAFLAVRRQIGGGRIVLCELSPEITEIFSVCRLIPANGNHNAPFEVAGSIGEARLVCGLS